MVSKLAGLFNSRFDPNFVQFAYTRNTLLFKSFFIKELACFVVHTYFDQTENTVDETTLTFERMH